MNKLKKLWSKLPWYIKNAYTLSFAVFAIWMIAVDRNSLFSQYSINQKLSELESQKEYYLTEIDEVNALKTELFSTDENKEKFARENYLMKKENEDIFIIVEK